MSETPPAQDDIQRMLREAQDGSEITGEFAWICLRLFRDACNDAVTWQRTSGRRYVLEGHDPEAIRRVVEEDVERARGELRSRLTGLLAWARETGRM